MLKKLKQQNLIKNMMALFFLQLANYVFPLLVLPFYTRLLPMAEFGHLMMIFSGCSIALILTDFGFNLSATYDISKNQQNVNFISKLVTQVVYIKLVIIAFVLAVFYNLNSFKFIAFNPADQFITFIIIAAIIITQAFQPLWFFQGIEKMKVITVATVTAKSTYVFLVFAIVPYAQSINTILMCFLTGNIIATGIYIRLMYKEGIRFKKVSIHETCSTFFGSSSYFLSRLAVSIYTSASTLIIGSLGNPSQAALYGASEKIYQAGQNILSPVSQALFPHAAKTGDFRIILKFMLYLSLPLAVGCGVVSLFSAELLGFIFGEAYAAGGYILNYLLVLIVITFISINFGYPIFAAIGHPKIPNITVLIGAIAFMISAWFLNKVGYPPTSSIIFSLLLTELLILIMRISLFFKFKPK